ncbi:MAG: CD225/dispanin family protein [candidate division KSB1 bacterium]|nr:CD225/dispanin family protein [candidate division KSB1 bacterium]MDZ7300532.1 CD225/dispanin family protein [candidate division KSB1 bacterium]MDZ7309671.1 CD225/dispanin family protein [candidate division KSB1 bacterium]
MYCPKCGTPNADTALRCVSCGNTLQPLQTFPMTGQTTQHVPNYLVQAILTTLFCCLPFGIVAIVYAAQVNSKLTAGNYAGAVEASNKAKTWCWVSFGVGLGVGLIYLLIFIGGGLSHLSNM